MSRTAALLTCLLVGTTAQADWKLYYTGEAARMFGGQGRGSWPTRQGCEQWRLSHLHGEFKASFEYRRSYCAGFDSPRGGGYTYRPSYSGGGSRGFAAQVMGGLLQSFMQGFQQGMQAPPRDPEAERRAAEARRQAEEAQRIAAFKAWQQRIREDLARQDTQFRDLRRQEVVLEARMLGDLLAQRLAPPVNPQAERLLQSACWSRKAALAAARGDEAGAEEARSRAALALEGNAPPCTDDLPAVPIPATPAPLDGLTAELGGLVREETTRVEAQIQDLMARQLKVRETLDQRREAFQAREAEKAQAKDPAAQAEADRLLAEARQALDEALDESLKVSQDLGTAQDALQALKAVGTLAPAPAAKGTAK